MSTPQRQGVILELPIYVQRLAEASDPLYMRHLLINIVVKISDTDAISTIFTWHQVKASTPRLPYTQYIVIDAPRRHNVEFYGPSDPFDRPMFLYISHCTLSGTPFVLSIAIYLFEWQGSIVIDADIQQVHTRNRRTTDPIQLVLPSETSQDISGEQGRCSTTEGDHLTHLTN